MKKLNELGNGYLSLPLMRGSIVVVGGPYFDRPAGLYGVKLAAEIKSSCEIDLPIVDFKVPQEQKLNAALRELLREIGNGVVPYVGCMGGRGRTGLFLACLTKAWGVPSPVTYVREQYFPHAVETKEQFDWVARWKVPLDIRIAVKRLRFMSLLFGSPQRKHQLLRPQSSVA